jgi:hypothetical protein
MLLRLFISVLALFSLCGCAGGKSTRLTAEDLSSVASDIGQKLAASEFIQARDASSERMTIALNRAENLTDDLVPHRELWYLMSSVRDNAGLVELGKAKNFALVIPAERLAGNDNRAAISEQSVMLGEGNVATNRKPTHTIEATLRNAVRTSTQQARAAGFARSDIYLADFRLQALNSGELVWSDSVEIKRQAFGRSFD